MQHDICQSASARSAGFVGRNCKQGKACPVPTLQIGFNRVSVPSLAEHSQTDKQ